MATKQLNMSFNPFRSPSSPSKRIRSDEFTDNPPPTTSSHRQNHKSPSSAPLSSWFSSWTTSTHTTTTTTTSRITAAATANTAISSAIIIQDDESSHHAEKSTTVSLSSNPPQLASQTSPAKSMTMNRGMDSPEGGMMHHQMHDELTNSKSPLHDNLSPAAAGVNMQTIQQNGYGKSAGVDKSNDGNNDIGEPDLSPYPSYPRPKSAPQKQIIDSSPRTDKTLLQDSLVEEFVDEPNLPPYPQPKNAPQKQIIDSSPRTDKAILEETLLEEFPSPGTAPPVAHGKITSKSRSASTSLFKSKLALQKEETTFPGFALYQLAKSRYCLGKHSQALDTTTECLALQKSSFSGNEVGGASAGGAKQMVSPADTVGNVAGNIGSDANASMTQLDLRTAFVAGVGSSVLGVVQSLRPSESATTTSGPGHPPKHHHPMLSNSIAVMASQYPPYPCVAQTLLLRGRLLSECAMYDGDFSLLLQAIQHVEMSVAIQRKLVISDEEELATSLILLGNMRARLGHFNEADMAYREGLAILREVRHTAKICHADAVESGDSETTSDCANYLKRITADIVTALYLHGKSYQCQRMHAEAFECYNKALSLRKEKFAASRLRLTTKRIARCMKSKYALERLLSTYWDDRGVI